MPQSDNGGSSDSSTKDVIRFPRVKKKTHLDYLRKQNKLRLAARREMLQVMRASMPQAPEDGAKKRKPRRNALRLAIVAVLMLVRLDRAIIAKREGKLQPKPTPSNTTTTGGGNNEEKDAKQPAKSERGGRSPLRQAFTDFKKDESDHGSIFGKNPQDDSEDDEDDGLEQGFFPSAKDLEEYPMAIVDSVYGSAIRSLTRCLDIFRLKRSLAYRKSKRVKPTEQRVGTAVWERSTIFQDWPSGAIAEFIEGGHLEKCGSGEPIYYCNEPTTHLKFLLDGVVVQLRRRNANVKAVSSAHNSSVVQRLEGPIVLRETAALVEELHVDAFEAVSQCEVLVVPIERVNQIYQKLPPQVKASVNQRCVERRQRLTVEDGIRWRELANSPLLGFLNESQLERIGRTMVARSYLKQSNIITTDDPNSKMEGHSLMLIAKGEVAGVTQYKAADGTWQDMRFSTWGPGDCLGEKAVYFKERFLFDIRAETNVDVWLLPRSELMQLAFQDRALKQSVANGAFSVRCSDPSVRMMYHTIRNIPCVRLAVRSKLLHERHVREIHSLFEFRIFPANELITSCSAPVTEMVVVMLGSASTDVSGNFPFPTPKSTVLGSAGIVSMRWRYATLATTSCEGWTLPVNKLVKYFEGLGILHHMQRFAVEAHEEDMASEQSKFVMEVRTPQHIIHSEMAAKRDEAFQIRHRAPVKKSYERFMLKDTEFLEVIKGELQMKKQRRDGKETALVALKTSTSADEPKAGALPRPDSIHSIASHRSSRSNQSFIRSFNPSSGVEPPLTRDRGSRTAIFIETTTTDTATTQSGSMQQQRPSLLGTSSSTTQRPMLSPGQGSILRSREDSSLTPLSTHHKSPATPSSFSNQDTDGGYSNSQHPLSPPDAVRSRGSQQGLGAWESMKWNPTPNPQELNLPGVPFLMTLDDGTQVATADSAPVTPVATPKSSPKSGAKLLFPERQMSAKDRILAQLGDKKLTVLEKFALRKLEEEEKQTLEVAARLARIRGHRGSTSATPAASPKLSTGGEMALMLRKNTATSSKGSKGSSGLSRKESRKRIECEAMAVNPSIFGSATVPSPLAMLGSLRMRQHHHQERHQQGAMAAEQPQGRTPAGDGRRRSVMEEAREISRMSAPSRSASALGPRPASSLEVARRRSSTPQTGLSRPATRGNVDPSASRRMSSSQRSSHRTLEESVHGITL